MHWTKPDSSYLDAPTLSLLWTTNRCCVYSGIGPWMPSQTLVSGTWRRRHCAIGFTWCISLMWRTELLMPYPPVLQVLSAPPLMELPDDIAATQDSFLSPSALSSSFPAGIRIPEPQSPVLDIDDAVLDAGLAALSYLKAVTWDRVSLATARDPDMHELLTIIESGFPDHRQDLSQPPTGIPPVSWWPLHIWWGHTLQRTDHHTPQSPSWGAVCSPCCPSRRELNAGTSWVFSVLAQHHSCGQWHAGLMWSLQSHCPIPTHCPTCSTHFPSLSIPVCLCRLLPLRRGLLLGGGRQIFQLTHSWGC